MIITFGMRPKTKILKNFIINLILCLPILVKSNRKLIAGSPKIIKNKKITEEIDNAVIMTFFTVK